MNLKPRLGDIATPGRVCSPHNEIYDCRIRPNGIGCLRWRSTRRRLGCRPAARPAGQEPVFRAGSASERNDLPIRSARFPMKAPGGLQFRQRAEKRERRSKTNSPGIVLSVRRCTAPRATEPEMRSGRDRSVRESGSALRSPRVRKLVRPVSGQYGSAFPGRNAGRTRNICQTRLHTLLHQPFWEVFSAHTFRWLETLWHGAGWKILALGTFGILMHMIGLPNTSPYRNPDKKQGSFL